MQTDLSKLPVLMQGFQPCCTEAALVANIEFYYLLKTGVYTPLSFRFLAALTAAEDMVNYQTSGTSLAVALQIAKEVGVCTAATYPNDITLYPMQFVDTTQIPQAAYTEAANFKIPDFLVLTDTSWEGINNAIAQYKLVLTGLYLNKDWYLSSVPNSNPLPLPPPMGMTDPSISKHMTLSSGSDSKNRYGRNSFGTTFGQNGDFYYTEAYQPYIFSGAVILDPVIQSIQQQATQLADEVAKFNPNSPTAPQQISLISKVIGDIEKEIDLIP